MTKPVEEKKSEYWDVVETRLERALKDLIIDAIVIGQDYQADRITADEIDEKRKILLDRYKNILQLNYHINQ